MSRKNLVLTSALLLAVLALGSFSALMVSAWSTENLTTALSPTSCQSSPGCVVGTSVTDSATITVTPENCNGGCNYGTVTFQVYAYTGGSCSSYSSGAISGFPGPASKNTVSVPSSLSSGSATVSSSSFSTSGLTGTKYVWVVNYVSGGGSNSWPSYGPVCETMFIQQTSGVPQFPLGSLGMLALLGIMVPAMIVLRSRFTRKTLA
jgi:hypothetical protein